MQRQVRLEIESATRAHALAPSRPAIAFPSSAAELRDTDFFNTWWYYDAELLPGACAQGIYPRHMPMLPRILLRQCELEDKSCLDIGPMEGLIPVLMKRGGANRVLAVDAIDHCAEKMQALKHYYGVEFDFQVVGLMYDLATKLGGEGFDLINCSGLLYHVYSPLQVLSGLRPLLKRNGLLIVSTGVIRDAGFSMEFNNAGRVQEEANTFWYSTVPLLDYLLRYLALAPIDCVYYPHMTNPANVRHLFDKPSGYLSVVCRAGDDVLPANGDDWMRRSARHSWEHRGLCDWALAQRQPLSAITYRGKVRDDFWRTETNSLDLWKSVQNLPGMLTAERPEDSHLLRLVDYS